ncbi:hypothetical protein DT076_16740 [Desertihabitans brevis]|uniref:Uncharacterized protein n=1 Tax=Desertihabitans brevis TaxID=2268447 RepID=A0A367YR41_9ACTN|nr:hypothetical protein [Desertihabitans brevis]RCK68294.1 hypothetical protein DT076_16740 [Desertihabitans brevis]
MSQPLLFDVGPLARHMVLPNMSLACGRDLLATCDAADKAGRTESVLSTSSADTTCPACLAEPIRDLIRWMQTDVKTRGPRPGSGLLPPCQDVSVAGRRRTKAEAAA